LFVFALLHFFCCSPLPKLKGQVGHRPRRIGFIFFVYCCERTFSSSRYLPFPWLFLIGIHFFPILLPHVQKTTRSLLLLLLVEIEVYSAIIGLFADRSFSYPFSSFSQPPFDLLARLQRAPSTLPEVSSLEGFSPR